MRLRHGQERGNRSRLRRRGHRRRIDSSGGEQRQRVDVPVLVRRHANAHVDVRLSRDPVLALADRADRRAFFDGVAAHDRGSAELQQRHRVAVVRPERHHAAPVRDAAHEPDRAGHGRPNRRVDRGGDVDSPVLPTRVRIALEHERAEHRTVDGPAPRARIRRANEQEQRNECNDAQHFGLRVRVANERTTLGTTSVVVNTGDSSVTVLLHSCHREAS